MNFKVKECRMFVNQEYPWLHATPDFRCSCDCSGEGCGKIECPYCLKDFQEYSTKQGSCLNINMTVEEDHQYYYQLQQELCTTREKCNDFVVCSIKENIEFVCQRVTPNQHHWDTVFPKLTNFWRFCVLPEILGHWYTQKRDITLTKFDNGALYFAGIKLERLVHCSNTACPISSCHLSCLKLTGVPKNWMCSLCRNGSPPQKPKRPSMSDDTTKEAFKLDTAICICNQKATTSDKLIECHNNPCANGTFFHLSCMNYKHKPNNAKTT